MSSSTVLFFSILSFTSIDCSTVSNCCSSKVSILFNNKAMPYQKDLDGNELYEKDSTGSEKYETNNDGNKYYAKTFDNTEIYAKDYEGSEYAIYDDNGDHYAKKNNGDEYYPKNNDGSFSYLINKDQKPFYAKKADGSEFYITVGGPIQIDLREVYAVDSNGNEIYMMKPEVYFMFDFVNDVRYYARNADGEEYYPKDDKDRFNIIHDNLEPQFIPNGDLNFVHIDHFFIYKIGTPDHFIQHEMYRTDPSGGVGNMYIDAMTGRSPRFLQAWRKANLTTEPFLRRPLKYRGKIDVFYRGNQNFIFLKDQEVLVEFDKRNRMLCYELSNTKRLYFDLSKGKKLYYKKTGKLKSYFDIYNGQKLNYFNNDIFYESTRQPNVLKLKTRDGVFIKTVTIYSLRTRIHQKLDENENIICYVQNPRLYFTYIRNDVRYFDYVRLNSELKKRFFVFANNERQYYRLDTNEFYDDDTPSVDPESEDEENIMLPLPGNIPEILTDPPKEDYHDHFQPFDVKSNFDKIKDYLKEILHNIQKVPFIIIFIAIFAIALLYMLCK